MSSDPTSTSFHQFPFSSEDSASSSNYPLITGIEPEQRYLGDELWLELEKQKPLQLDLSPSLDNCFSDRTLSPDMENRVESENRNCQRKAAMGNSHNFYRDLVRISLSFFPKVVRKFYTIKNLGLNIIAILLMTEGAILEKIVLLKKKELKEKLRQKKHQKFDEKFEIFLKWCFSGSLHVSRLPEFLKEMMDCSGRQDNQNFTRNLKKIGEALEKYSGKEGQARKRCQSLLHSMI